jgi:ABC-type Fe3+/spermidine/putrescine transport system ATPase subunit
MLAVEHLALELGGFRLTDLSFEVAAGDYCVLLGASGAGKTLILELIAGLLRPDGGRLLLDGVDLAQTPVQRRGFGLVYQDHALFPHLSVRGNLAYHLPRAGRDRLPALAGELGIAPLLDRAPGTLSLGEAQRVALARSLARRPRLLLLDEPLASLDPVARSGIRALLRRLHQGGQTILHVTHDYEEAVALATRVLVLEAGRIVQSGSPEEVFRHPRTPFVASFVRIRNFFRGRVRAEGGRRIFVGDGLRLTLTDDAPPGPACAFFDASAVTVAREPVADSARNHLPGLVVDWEPVPGGFDLILDAGAPLVARVTGAAFSELGIAPGTRLFLALKSSAIRVLTDPTEVAA